LIDLAQRLPEPVLKDCIGLIDFSEFSGEPLDTVVEKVLAHHVLTNEDFHSIFAEVKDKKSATRKFYTDSKNYVYDILGATNSFEGTSNKNNQFLSGVMQRMKDAGPKFLEFGGGTGIMCEMMATWGQKAVTYTDVIGSYVSEFAQWRFKKYNLDIEVKLLDQEDFELDDTYDVIFTDAVWEHLMHHQQLTYAAKLAKALNKDGLLVLIADLSGECEAYPMHFDININETNQVLINEGLTSIQGNGFATVWIRP